MRNIGPQLPPHLADRLAQEQVDDDEPASSEQMPSRSVGPQLPPHLIKEDAASRSIGPQLPPHLTAGDNADQHDPEEKEAEEDDGGSYGPALPPSLESARADERRNIGPQLPPHILERLRQREAGDDDDDEDSPSKRPRPAYEAEADDSDDDEAIGPRPPPAGASAAADADDGADAVRAFNERAERMRQQLVGDTGKPLQRPEWMTQLPQERDFLTGAATDPLRSRQFSRRDVTVKMDSSWTDTPADRERKRQERMQAAADGRSAREERAAARAAAVHVPSQRDLEIAKQVQQFNAEHRNRSLMEEYQQKHMHARTAAATDEAKRPFDRDRDLTARSMTPEQRAEYLKRAGELGSRFSAGRQTFL